MKNAIRITGARENNLKNISLEIPKGKITVFTGVSGAGKSSLVFDTIAAEAQRQLNATFTNYLPLAGRPDADSLQNLTASVVINQKQIRGNNRSTVGTITEIFSLLRLLFSRIGEPHIGFSNAFSFNEPEGMCPECDGLGEKVNLDLEKLLDRDKSINQGAIRFPILSYQWQRYASLGLFNGDKKLAYYTAEEWQMFLHGDKEHPRLKDEQDIFLRNYAGLIETFTRRYLKKDITALSEETQLAIENVTTRGICPLCLGTRLNRQALSSKINGKNIAQLASLEAKPLLAFLSAVDSPKAAPIISSINDGLSHLVTLGLDYLTLDRPTMTLSAGEAQRIKMIRHLGSSLTDLTYIFDEPTIGLHPHDVQGLNKMLQAFRDMGNTVLVVEHDPDVIAIADHIVDLGPDAGKDGGEIVYQGTLEGLLKSQTLTGQYLKRKNSIKGSFRQAAGKFTIHNATKHNLKNITVDIPEGVLSVITGVAGAGKSSLMEAFLEDYPQAIYFDQSPIQSSSRSITATYAGMMDEIRDLFADANKVSRSLFSFNSKGACPECNGSGTIEISLPFMDPVKSRCESCKGKRFKQAVLDYTWRGKSISDVLEKTVLEALSFFEGTSLIKQLKTLEDVGLGYLTLGQALSTYSGGESQRIKLSAVLQKSGSIYILDEPTVSLHMADLEKILSMLNQLVDEGNTVVVIEHNLEIVKNADWVIDLGPEGGTKGGQIIFKGTPREMLNAKNSHTAEHLRSQLNIS
ncbi:MAG: excinuclease ABC subunit UvrA [Brevefilum sp.]|nr:excinuclease ABC subunit UvrA [Brevefilum sp.]